MKHTAPATNRPRLQSDAPKALTNYNWAAATEHLAMALIENPAWTDGWLNLGLARLHLHQPRSAISALQRGIGLDPNRPKARCTLAEARLQAGDLKAAAEAGRDECWRLSDFPRRLSPEGVVLWQPGTKPRSPILSEPEQGPGDTIQFICLIPELGRRGYRLWLVYPKPMTIPLEGFPWFKRLLANTAEAAGADCRLQFVSLPSKQGVSDLVEFSEPYQKAPQPRNVSQSEAAQRGHGCRRVGFVWCGKPQHKNDQRRSSPILVFAQHLSLQGDWVNLHLGTAVTENLNLLQKQLETVAHISLQTRADKVGRRWTIDVAGSKFENCLETARAITATKANPHQLDYLQNADQTARRHPATAPFNPSQCIDSKFSRTAPRGSTFEPEARNPNVELPRHAWRTCSCP